MATKQEKWKPSKVTSTLSVPTIHHKKISAESDRNLPGKLVAVPFFDEWRSKNVQVEGFGSYDEVAVKVLDERILLRVWDVQKLTRYATDAQIQRAFDSTTFTLRPRTIEMVSVAAMVAELGIPEEAVRKMLDMKQFAGYTIVP